MTLAMTRRVLIPPLAVPPVVACAGEIQRLAGETMGTTWSVMLVAAGADLPRLKSGIQARLDTVVSQMSNWEAHSDISRFNQAAPGSWHVLPDEFFRVLSYAVSLARDTGGAYDPTIGHLVNLWGFGPEGASGRLPHELALAGALAQSGWEAVRLDAARGSAFQPGNIEIDLSSIAKGFGVDEVADYLGAAGIGSYLVEVGGELRGHGVKPDGVPWWVMLEEPLVDGAPSSPGLPETVVALCDLSVATSGDYRRYFEHAGCRYSHTIDPRTGRPVPETVASVSVLHPECMCADALATALTSLGLTAGLAFARRHDIAARFVIRRDRGFVEHMSPAFAAMLD